MWQTKPNLTFIELNHFILDQLHIEELLLRQKEQNFCLVNMGSKPAIVMGISKKPHLELEPSFFSTSIPLIQRFSGGGTVFVDQNTFFFTMILNKKDLNFAPFPEKIMRAMEPIVQGFCPSISLKENDFVIEDRKIGGNAQYLTKNRVLHHISFLWDFEPKNMDYLKLPEKIPDYRKKRSHVEFLATLKEQMPKKQIFAKVKQALQSHFQVQQTNMEDLLFDTTQELRTKLVESSSLNLKDSLGV